MRKEEIGNATVYLGDSMEILPTLGLVDAVVTDPPYGINTKSDGDGKLNPWADLCNSAFWYTAWIRECHRRLQPHGALWTCLNWRSLVTFQKAALDAKWSIESLLVWDKCWIGPGGSRGLRPSYELVALMARENFSIDDRGLPDVQRFKWSSIKPNGHPAEKPVDLMRFLINNSTVEDAVVLDPFLGSGTTAIAALETGRRVIGIEQDPAWFDLACKRIENSQRQQKMFG
jgi:site-specific DNA-methyltransferase (adenine-specific)